MKKNAAKKKPVKAKKPAPKAKPKAVKVASKKAPKSAKVLAKPAPKAAKVAKPAPKVKGKEKAQEKAPDKRELAKVKAPKVEAPKVEASKKAAAPVKEKSAEVSAKGKQKAQQMVREALKEAAMTALPEKEVVLTNAEGLRYCKVADCDELATTDSYCRFHYLLNWKKIQLRKRILAGDKLDRYIEELTTRYPDRFLEMIRKDLASEKDFLAAIQEMEIDDSGDDAEFEDDARTYIDEVRGVTTGGGEGQDDDF